MSEKIYPIKQLFLAALQTFISKKCNQTYLAKKTEIDKGTISNIVKGVHGTSDKNKIKIIKALDFKENELDKFLNIGRQELLRREGISPAEPVPVGARIPYSSKMALEAPGQGRIPVDAAGDDSPVTINLGLLGKVTDVGLQAVRVCDSAMEPFFCDGDVVIVDTLNCSPAGIEDGKFYVVCCDRTRCECSVRTVSKMAQGYLAVGQAGSCPAGPLLKKPKDIHLVGRVIWLSRCFQ
ncbi:MAG: LexA family transcriptional regulator [Deltaproteobacteria bacterium]|jgi:hypothetical protein|nr:LexA family transcriptional regulator [Deltaproteobacteria bacterium]